MVADTLWNVYRPDRYTICDNFIAISVLAAAYTLNHLSLTHTKSVHFSNGTLPHSVDTRHLHHLVGYRITRRDWWRLWCFGEIHDDFIKWKHFPRYWPFLRGIHRSPVNSPQKGQCRGALMFSLICAWINGWVNNREAGDLKRYRAHYDVTVMIANKSADTVPILLYVGDSVIFYLGI